MKKLLLALALILAPTVASAQCTGVFPNNTVCANITGASNTPRATATSAVPFIPSFPILAPNGTAAAPSYSFAASPGTGIYSTGVNELGIATNGANAFEINDRGTLVSPSGYSSPATVPIKGTPQDPFAIPNCCTAMDGKIVLSSYWINNTPLPATPYVYYQISSYCVAQGNVWCSPVGGTGTASGAEAFAWGVSGVAACNTTVSNCFGAEFNVTGGGAASQGDFNNAWVLSLATGGNTGNYPTGFMYWTDNGHGNNQAQQGLILRDASASPIKSTGNIIASGYTALGEGTPHLSVANGINFLNTTFSGYPFIFGTGATPLWYVDGSGNSGTQKLSVINAGTAALPSLYFAGDSSTGFYRPSANTIALSVNGTAAASFNSSTTTIAATGVLKVGTGIGTGSGNSGLCYDSATGAVTYNATACTVTMPANTIRGNNTGSTANAANLTVAQTQTLLSYPVILGGSATVDFNTTNTDHAITITSPTANYKILQLLLINNGATASLTTARGGVFTSTGGGGVTLAADQALSAITSNTVTTLANMITIPGTNTNTIYLNSGTIYYRNSTAQGAAASGKIYVYIEPLP